MCVLVWRGRGEGVMRVNWQYECVFGVYAHLGIFSGGEGFFYFLINYDYLMLYLCVLVFVFNFI